MHIGRPSTVHKYFTNLIKTRQETCSVAHIAIEKSFETINYYINAHLSPYKNLFKGSYTCRGIIIVYSVFKSEILILLQ